MRACNWRLWQLWHDTENTNGGTLQAIRQILGYVYGLKLEGSGLSFLHEYLRRYRETTPTEDDKEYPAYDPDQGLFDVSRIGSVAGKSDEQAVYAESFQRLLGTTKVDAPNALRFALGEKGILDEEDFRHVSCWCVLCVLGRG